MDYLDSDDIIIACSSGANSNTAIALIRISGFKDISIFGSYFDTDLSIIKPRYANYTKLLDKGVELDSIVLTYFEGPNSYNGENLLELGVHGNTLNIERIINLFIRDSFTRYAEPGEFTYRALRNKKLTLPQVEGLDLFLNSTSGFGLEQGLSLLNGDLQDQYIDLYKDFLNHKSAVELSIDFLDDMGEEESKKQFDLTFKNLETSLTKLHQRVSNNSLNLASPQVVIIGQPNSGKSTLFNKILGNDRAIVSEIEGTTRDYLSEQFKISDTYFSLVDTAGLRETADIIEEKGIKLTFEQISKSFFKVLLVNPFSYDLDSLSELKKYEIDLLLLTHSDVEGFEAKANKLVFEIGDTFGPIEPLSKNGPIEPVQTCGPIEPLSKNGPIEPVLSYCNYSSFNDETDIISELVIQKYNKIIEKNPISIERQKVEISNSYRQFVEYSTLVSQQEDITIISSELNILGNCISRLIGITSPDDVLHNIFSNFCIGK